MEFLPTESFAEIHIPISIFKERNAACVAVAKEIAAVIREKQANNENCILGFATGSSPIGVYKELVRMHKEEALSFENVISFNLDEYYRISPTDPQSYHYFMKQHLLDHVNIKRWNIPNGTLAREVVGDFCSQYERLIENYGHIDVQILGIGRTGHIGFNEPPSSSQSRTRLIKLAPITKQDAARDFGGEENVPGEAITMGIKTILEAKRVILMAWGEGKASVMQKALEGQISPDLPASFLQSHPNVTAVLDEGNGPCVLLSLSFSFFV
jgi:glucosamine-6-phosphate deaminase